MTPLPEAGDPVAAADAGLVDSGPPKRRAPLARRMVTNAIGNAAPIAAALVTAPVLAHTLGVNERGQVAAATAPFLLATTCATLGIPDAVNYFVARSTFGRSFALRRGGALVLVSSAITTAIVMALSGPLSGGDHRIRQLTIVSACLIVPALMTAVLRGAAAGEHLWSRVARERIINACFRFVSVLALAVAGHLSTLTATVAISVAPAAGALAYLRLPTEHPVDPATADASPASPNRLMLTYGSKVWLGAVSGVLLSRLDQTIMTPLSNAYQLGLYAVAVSIGELPLIVNTAIREVMFSADASSSEDEQLLRAARVSFFLSLVMAIGISLTMPIWLPTAFGSAFKPAIGTTAILVFAVALGTPGSIAGSGLGARGRPGLRSASLTVACAVNIALLVALVPSYGAKGAAVATLVGNIISANGNILFLRRFYGLPIHGFYAVRIDDVRVIVRNLTRPLAKALRRLGLAG